MKVVFVTTDSFIDHSYTIASELKKKIDLQVLILAKKKTEEIERWCNDLNAEFVARKRYRNPFSFFSELKLITKLKKIKADKVWFNTLNFYQAIAARFLLKNIIITVHDVEFHPESKDYFTMLSHKITFLLFKQRICTASKTQAGIFRNIYGFEPEIFQLPIIDYYTKVSSNPVNKENPFCNRFFFFGSLLPYKGIETLIDAAKILTERKLNFSLCIYGKIKYKEMEIKNKISELNNIILFNEFINYKDVQSIFCENDVLILPYRQVTQCGPLLIAYNTRVPVICRDLPGFREYVEEGKSGFLFNNTPEDLADKMEYILNNPGKINEIKAYIEREITKRFSMQSLTENYIETFKH